MSTAGAGESLSGPRLQGKGGPEPLASRPSPSSAHSTIRPQSGLICCPFHHCPLVRGRDYTRPHPQRFTEAFLDEEEVGSEASPGGKSAHSGSCEEPHARRSSLRRECDPACQLVALGLAAAAQGRRQGRGLWAEGDGVQNLPCAPDSRTSQLPGSHVEDGACHPRTGRRPHSCLYLDGTGQGPGWHRTNRSTLQGWHLQQAWVTGPGWTDAGATRRPLRHEGTR